MSNKRSHTNSNAAQSSPQLALKRKQVGGAESQNEQHLYTQELHQMIGGAAPPPIQPKLEMGGANDAYEQQADAMADQIVQRKAEGPASNGAGLSTALASNAGGGKSLTGSLRQEMESGFGTNFGGVRIHTDAQADAMSRSINAKAFTHGSDIYFKQGNYNPGTSGGKHLLAHELTHTMQQAKMAPRIQRRVEGDPTAFDELARLRSQKKADKEGQELARLEKEFEKTLTPEEVKDLRKYGKLKTKLTKKEKKQTDKIKKKGTKFSKQSKNRQAKAAKKIKKWTGGEDESVSEKKSEKLAIKARKLQIKLANADQRMGKRSGKYTKKIDKRVAKRNKIRTQYNENADAISDLKLKAFERYKTAGKATDRYVELRETGMENWQNRFTEPKTSQEGNEIKPLLSISNLPDKKKLDVAGAEGADYQYDVTGNLINKGMKDRIAGNEADKIDGSEKLREQLEAIATGFSAAKEEGEESSISNRLTKLNKAYSEAKKAVDALEADKLGVPETKPKIKTFKSKESARKLAGMYVGEGHSEMRPNLTTQDKKLILSYLVKSPTAKDRELIVEFILFNIGSTAALLEIFGDDKIEDKINPATVIKVFEKGSKHIDKAKLKEIKKKKKGRKANRKAGVWEDQNFPTGYDEAMGLEKGANAVVTVMKRIQAVENKFKKGVKSYPEETLGEVWNSFETMPKTEGSLAAENVIYGASDNDLYQLSAQQQAVIDGAENRNLAKMELFWQKFGMDLGAAGTTYPSLETPLATVSTKEEFFDQVDPALFESLDLFPELAAAYKDEDDIRDPVDLFMANVGTYAKPQIDKISKFAGTYIPKTLGLDRFGNYTTARHKTPLIIGGSALAVPLGIFITSNIGEGNLSDLASLSKYISEQKKSFTFENQTIGGTNYKSSLELKAKFDAKDNLLSDDIMNGVDPSLAANRNEYFSHVSPDLSLQYLNQATRPGFTEYKHQADLSLMNRLYLANATGDVNFIQGAQWAQENFDFQELIEVIRAGSLDPLGADVEETTRQIYDFQAAGKYTFTRGKSSGSVGGSYMSMNNFDNQIPTYKRIGLNASTEIKPYQTILGANPVFKAGYTGLFSDIDQNYGSGSTTNSVTGSMGLDWDQRPDKHTGGIDIGGSYNFNAQNEQTLATFMVGGDYKMNPKFISNNVLQCELKVQFTGTVLQGGGFRPAATFFLVLRPGSGKK